MLSILGNSKLANALVQTVCVFPSPTLSQKSYHAEDFLVNSRFSDSNYNLIKQCFTTFPISWYSQTLTNAIFKLKRLGNIDDYKGLKYKHHWKKRYTKTNLFAIWLRDFYHMTIIVSTPSSSESMSTLLYRGSHTVRSKGESGCQKSNQHLIWGNVRIINHKVSELGIKYLLSVSYLTGIVLDTKNSFVDKSLCLKELTFQWKTKDNKLKQFKRQFQ